IIEIFCLVLPTSAPVRGAPYTSFMTTMLKAAASPWRRCLANAKPAAHIHTDHAKHNRAVMHSESKKRSRYPRWRSTGFDRDETDSPYSSPAAAPDHADLEILAAAHVPADLPGEVTADERDVVSALDDAASILAVEVRVGAIHVELEAEADQDR